MVPSAIWACALSPITTALLYVNGTIEIPAYTADSSSIWDSGFETKIQPGGDVQL
jgi:hypothetical protein